MKILKLLFWLFVFCLLKIISANSISVEDIFSDIDSNYTYLEELQELYDDWIILLSDDWKFNPYKPLTRDEFIWMSLETTCNDCVQPNVDIYYTNKYITESFYDVEKTNKNFYCIEDALNNNYIKGYDVSYTCDDGTFLTSKIPFCPNNTIILEEALAIILRISGILTNKEAEEIRQDIADWIITTSLSSDIHPTNPDWSIYSFYPDFKKALEYEIVEYDSNWNKKTYNLIETVDNKLNPKKNINKEEFLHIAYATLKASSCIKKDLWSFALKMDILDKSCQESDIDCTFSWIDSLEYTYDFKPIVSMPLGDDGLCIWNYFNTNTNEKITKYWFYIDDFTFFSDWLWNINLTCIDEKWNSAKAYNNISVWNINTLNSYIISDYLEWNFPYKLDLELYSSGWDWNYTYEWDFWDWNSWFWDNTTYIYKKPWIYNIRLKVTDDSWNTSESNYSIEVLDIQNTELNDYDWDLINDLDDNCPLIFWVIKNNWCPIFESSCTGDDSCQFWYKCFSNISWEWFCLPKSLWGDCNYSNSSLIYWGNICNACPCSNSLDFIANLRTCDTIFPAIVSPNGIDIYGLWRKYNIK